ncbi:MAG TPA: formate dehydrogenase accessory protein FdhE [Anaeromyxobacteraceae bacterium]|nr:formate dehydrogenase accessory protein FdhE [Anaeromyxobacteraceae bacterium]
MTSARRRWLASHPYLEPIARFQGMVEDAAREPPAPLALPSFESYASDQAAGVPLLQSRSAGLDVSAAAAEALDEMLERLAAASPPGRIGQACRDLRGELGGRGERVRAIAWVASGAEPPPSAHPGLLRFLGWMALRRVLGPVVERSAAWHDEARWGRGSCPTCGALPLSAQLVPREEGRLRFLACGCCGTRWRYRRIGCPVCGTEAQGALGILQVEGEEGLRIDVCNECRAYVKTYTGEGEEDLFLADWPTLHLDVLATGRGYERVGASLYELPKDERRIEP